MIWWGLVHRLNHFCCWCWSKQFLLIVFGIMVFLLEVALLTPLLWTQSVYLLTFQSNFQILEQLEKLSAEIRIRFLFSRTIIETHRSRLFIRFHSRPGWALISFVNVEITIDEFCFCSWRERHDATKFYLFQIKLRALQFNDGSKTGLQMCHQTLS